VGDSLARAAERRRAVEAPAPDDDQAVVWDAATRAFTGLRSSHSRSGTPRRPFRRTALPPLAATTLRGLRSARRWLGPRPAPGEHARRRPRLRRTTRETRFRSAPGGRRAPRTEPRAEAWWRCCRGRSRHAAMAVAAQREQRRLLTFDHVEQAARRLSLQHARIGVGSPLGGSCGSVVGAALDLVEHPRGRPACVNGDRHVYDRDELELPSGCQQALRLGDGLQALRGAVDPVDPADDPIEQGLRRLHGVIVATRGSHAIGELADAGRGNP
jgi:hypothetical protein